MAGSLKTRPPHGGGIAGAVEFAEAEITFAAANARQLIASLPVDAIVLDRWFEITTPFDSGTSDELNIGWGAVGAATSDDLLDAVDGQGAAGVYPTTRGIPAVRLAAAQDIYAYHLTAGTDPTEGAARACIVFVRTADNG
jgi:hypothetical protein